VLNHSDVLSKHFFCYITLSFMHKHKNIKMTLFSLPIFKPCCLISSITNYTEILHSKALNTTDYVVTWQICCWNNVTAVTATVCKLKCKGKVVPLLQLSTTPWRCTGGWRYITATLWKVKCKGKVVPLLQLSTTPWRCIGGWRYSSTHSWPWH
jgi:hypothetical protein